MMSSAGLFLRRIASTPSLQRLGLVASGRSWHPASRAAAARQLASFSSVFATAAQEDVPKDEGGAPATTAGSLDEHGRDPDPPEDTLSSDKDEEQEVQTGYIPWANYEKGFGLIIVDPEFRTKGAKKKLHFAFSNIYPELKRLLGSRDFELVKPVFDLNKRIEYRLVRRKQGDTWRNRGDVRPMHLRYEGGHRISMLHYGDALTLIRRVKARLGKNVYEILSSPDLMSEDDLAKRIDGEFEHCDKKVQWAREQVTDPQKVRRMILAKFGEEVYDILSNIATVDDAERRADQAYVHCLGDLSELELNFSQKDESDEDNEKGGFGELLTKTTASGSE